MPGWRWAALLAFALVAPAGLPAGGAELRPSELRRRQSRGGGEPLLAVAGCELRCAPQHRAPVLARTELGMPLRVLRSWWAPGGQRWLQVELAGSDQTTGRIRRGWLVV
jgi:hypothetical protein